MTDLLLLPRVAADLRAIVELQERLESEAVHAAKDRLMPGGVAMVSLAPVASVQTWSWQLDAAERRAEREGEALKDTQPDLTADDDDWEPPLQMLLFWSEQWRAEHDMELEKGRRPTYKTEVNFLRWSLKWAWGNAPHFAVFAEDVATARRRMEDTLRDGTRPDRTRVVCDRCESDPPQLVKVWARRRATAYCCRTCSTTVDKDSTADHCPKCWTVAPPEPVWASDARNDRWKCPRCKHKFDVDEVKRAHAKQLRSESAAKFVLLPDAIATLLAQGRAERTIRKWLTPPVSDHTHDRCTRCGKTSPPQEYAACPRMKKGQTEECGGDLLPVFRPHKTPVVESYCDPVTHNVWVWWPDLWRLHLTTASRKRRAA